MLHDNEKLTTLLTLASTAEWSALAIALALSFVGSLRPALPLAIFLALPLALILTQLLTFPALGQPCSPSRWHCREHQIVRLRAPHAPAMPNQHPLSLPLRVADYSGARPWPRQSPNRRVVEKQSKVKRGVTRLDSVPDGIRQGAKRGVRVGTKC